MGICHTKIPKPTDTYILRTDDGYDADSPNVGTRPRIRKSKTLNHISSDGGGGKHRKGNKKNKKSPRVKDFESLQNNTRHHNDTSPTKLGKKGKKYLSSGENKENIRRTRTAPHASSREIATQKRTTSQKQRSNSVDLTSKSTSSDLTPSCHWIGAEKPYTSNRSLSKDDFDHFSESAIGRGACGHVKLVRCKANNRWYALKCFFKSEYDREKDVKLLRAEVDAINDLAMPFIVKLFGTFQDKKFVYLMMEYVAGGELFTHLRNSKCFSENKAKFYAAEALFAIEHIHAMNYMYRDLKPENCCIDHEGHLKLVDFGFAKKWDRSGRLYTKVGTPHYLAPEQLDRRLKDGYTKIVDIWAFGCFCYELCAGVSPFGTAKDTSYEVYIRVMKGRYRIPRFWSSELRSFLLRMMCSDPEKRLTDINEIREDPWFSNVDFKAICLRRVVPPHIPNVKIRGDRSNFDKYHVRDRKGKEMSRSKDAMLFSEF